MGNISILFDQKLWAQELGYGQPGDIEVAHLYSQSGGGLHYIKFNIPLPRNYSHPLLKAGKRIDVFRGPVRLGTAILAEPDQTNWTFVADGLFRTAEKVKVTPVVAPGTGGTRVQIDLYDAVNMPELGWNGVGNTPHFIIFNEVKSNDIQSPTVADLLDAYCTLTGKKWGLDANNTPYVSLDPTIPAWAYTPGVTLMPTNDETSVSVVKMSYLTGRAPDQVATVTAGAASFEGHQQYVDLTPLGVLPISQAQQYADDFIAQNGVRVTYTEGIDVNDNELTTPGGTSIAFWSAGILVCGQRGLHQGVVDKFLGSLGKTITYVIGSTIYHDNAAGGTLQMFAVDLSPRVVSTLLAQLKDIADAARDAYVSMHSQTPLQ